MAALFSVAQLDELRPVLTHSFCKRLLSEKWLNHRKTCVKLFREKVVALLKQ